MSKPQFDADSCSACGTCTEECPNGCLDLGDIASLARPDDCSECGTCASSCPNGAIAV
jgi:NAD-dependent dihydropyrimidine dehydrogenase PreA subunit